MQHCNSDGKIQMGEVIQYDLEKMKAVGVNTIRTYSSGVWHDKNLNNVQDAGETLQGDLPDWVYDEILAYANANNMKVIIGYWVQDEDLVGNPMVCNWTDFEIAKRTLSRVVNKYKNNEAVLAWGIGNEVQGQFNHEWFNWGVDIKDYLNQLNDYVRTLDGNHPIIYAKYVGEIANFNNMNADVISINTFTNTAQDLIDAGEFSTPVTSGKAYMLGEFGHNINDSDAQWTLAQQYAGGCFLELNNIWWKLGSAFGILTQYREKQAERYNKVQYLYTGGNVVCSSNAECEADSYIGNSFCIGKNITRNFTTYTCNNPGTIQSSCSQTTSARLNQTCSYSCSNGTCTIAPPVLGLLSEPFESLSAIIVNGGTVRNGAVSFIQQRCGTNAANLRAGSYITYNSSGRFPVSDDLTIEFWVLPGNKSSFGLFGIGSLSLNPRSLGIFSNYQYIYTEIRNNVAAMTQIHSWQTMNMTAWNHVAVVFTGNGTRNCSKIDVYLNGLKNPGTYAVCNYAPNLNNPLVVGGSGFYGFSYSSMDELRISNYSKTPAQINAEYNRMMNCTNQPFPVPICSSNAQCGATGFTGIPYCNGKDVWSSYRSFYCNYPGTVLSYCSNYTSATLKQTCAYSCSNGACVNPPSTFTNFYEPFESLTNPSLRGGVITGSYQLVNQYVNAGYGKAANMSAGQYISYPVAGNFPTNPSEFSVEFWVKPSAKLSYGLWGIGTLSGQQNSIGIFSNYQRIYLEMKNQTTGFQVSSSNLVNTRAWNHIAVTFTRKLNTVNCYESAIYLNSVKQPYSVRTICNFSPAATNIMYLARSGFYGSSYSLIDEFRIVNSSLTQAQISSDYSRMLSYIGK